MKLNRRGVTLGIASLGLVGAIAGGTGVALAATGTPTPASTSAPATSGTGDCPMGRSGGMHGMASGGKSPMTAAASYLGLSEADLQTRIQAGTSLADIAKAQGKPVSGLKDAITAGVKSSLDSNTALTSERKAAMLAQLTKRIDTMVNATHQAGAGMGPMGAMGAMGAMGGMGGMGAGMRGMQG